MKHQFAIILFVVRCLSLSGQTFDMMYQPGLSARATDVIFQDGSIFLSVISEVPGSFFATTSLLELDSTGAVQDEHPFFVPGNEIAFWQCIGSLNDTLLLAGVTSPGCDFGPFTGMLTSWYNDTILWNKVYYNSDSTDAEISMIDDMAVGDSTLLLTDGSVLMWTNNTGETIDRITLPWGSAHRVKRSIAGYFVAGNNGLIIFSEAADTLGVWNIEAVLDAIERPDGSFLLLTDNGLQLLNENLESIGNLIPMTIEGNPSLHAMNTNEVVITGDSVFIMNSSLEMIVSFALEEPDGFIRARSRIENGAVITAGTFTSGVTGAACRSVSIEGNIPADVPELELMAISLDSISYSLAQPPNGPVLFSASASFHVELKNNGPDTIRTATLNSIIPYGICSYSGTRIELSALDLPPNETVLLDAGPFQFFEYHSGTDSIEASLCIWATSPNHRLDQNRSNDTGCLSIPIMLHVTEQSPIDTYAVHPNPFEDRITITPPISSRTVLELLDITGRQIRSVQITGAEMTELFIPELPRGIYLLSISIEDQRSIRKLVHQ